MRLRGALLGLLAVLVAALAAMATPDRAEAAKVANPGPFNATVTDGFLRIKNETFEFDPNNPIRFAGTINSAGGVNIPESGQTYPPFTIDGGYTVRINPAAPITGTVDPLTGASNLRLKVWIKIDGVPFGGGCRIASSSSPIDVNALITGTTSPPGPNGPITGTPYNATNGTLTVVNNNYAVPSSSDCGFAAGTVNDTLGLPSSAGNNEAQFELTVNPIIRKGITAALAVSGTSGVKPYTVDFDASGSTRTAALRHYQWDFDGNGTFDRTTTTPTTSFTYVNAGTFPAKVRHIDVDGDFADATRTITVAEPPDLSVDSTHADPFRVGTTAQYNIAVRNHSVGPTNGGTTVTDTLPTGLIYNPTGSGGTGWSCSAVLQEVTCARAGSISGNTNAPALAIKVDVTAAALPGGTNQVSVSTTGDSNGLNDYDSDPTSVTAIDLAIDKSHLGSFRPGAGPENTYVLDVDNVGSAATVGPTTVTDTLPPGLTYVSASGTGWSCSASGQDVTCTRIASIPASGSADPIELAVDASVPAGDTSQTVTNTASVDTVGDTFASNDSDSDSTLIIDSPDAAITKSHAGNLTAGANATYTLAVANVGPQPTSGTTTVSDSLPNGLSFVSASGSGWSCSAVADDVTCDHAGSIAADAAAQPISLTVSVGLDAIPAVTNTASVSTPGDDNSANDSSSDQAVVRAIDLEIEKTHDEPFRVGREGTYNLDVANVGDSATVDAATVTDTLPNGLTYVDATGTGWTCGASGQDVTCTHADTIDAEQPAGRIELRVDVGSGAGTGVSNTAEVETTDDFNPGNDSSTDSTAIVEADAAVDISRTGSFRSESTGTYLLAVDNDGVTPTSGATTLTAVLPSGLAFISAAGDGWSCAEDTGTVTCTHASSIPAESSVPDVQLRVSIDRDAPDSVSTTATVATADDRNPDNDTDTDTATVSGPDLVVDSSHTGAFRVGGVGTYTLGVSNDGTDATREGTTLTDTLPTGLVFASASGAGWDCGAAGQVVTCTRSAEIAADSSAPNITLDVTVEPEAAPGATNEVTVATVGDRDPDSDSDSDFTNVEMIDLRLELDRDGPAVVGDEVVYQVAVDNVGDAATIGPAYVTDTLPTGVTPNEASGPGWDCAITGQEVSCDRDALLDPAQQAGPLTIRGVVTSNASDTTVNSATVSTTDDGNPANDSDSDQVQIVRSPDLNLTLDDQLPQDGSFRVGDEVGYRLTLLNEGGSPTDSTSELSIELGEGLSFVSAEAPGWTCTGSGRLVDCSRPAGIAAGERLELTVQAAVTDQAGDEAETTAAVVTSGDLDPSDDAAVVTSPVTRIDLSISKDYGDGPYVAGRQSTYEIAIRSLGSAATVGPATVRDALPAGISVASAGGDGWDCRGTGGELVCVHDAPIAPSASKPISVTVDVGDSAVPSISGGASVDTLDDVDASNDASGDSVEVSARPEDRELGRIYAKLAMKRARPTSTGIVYVRLLCPEEAENGCTGNVDLGSASKVEGGNGKRRRISFGSAAYDITQGHTLPSPIRLSGRHRDLLQRLGTIKANVVITPTGMSPESAPLKLRRR